ncbi:MAG: transposase [Ignavibacteria bacterium]|nr:transposase [Ignavibacteria bacterium]
MTMTLFNNKYRVESAKLKGWDYSDTSIYYVTICTENMTKFFGKISNGRIDLTSEGKIVKEEWMKTAEIRKNALLDEFIVMPNHLHGIIALTKSDEKLLSETSQRDVFTGSRLQPDTLSSIINQFKGKCTKRIREFNKEFKWHSRFHDRIIRSERELDNIRAYIHYNPQKWSKDEFYID